MLRGDWSQLLTEFRKFVKFGEQAARNFDRNKWADAFLKEIKESPTLVYMYHARNADEHGAFPVAIGEPASLSVGNMVSFSGSIRNVTISNCTVTTDLRDGSKIERKVDGEFSIHNGHIVDGWLKSEIPVRRQESYLRLESVWDRGSEYKLPNIGCAPDDVAKKLAQKAYDWMISKNNSLKAMK